MSAHLLATVLLFALALVFASVIADWRQALVGLAPVEPFNVNDLPRLSVIVPARDEEDKIASILQDLFAQHYPRDRTEVIVVDDGSTDRTAAIVEGMMRSWPQLLLLKSEGAGKKAAITTGVSAATGELVLLTDADVRCGPDRMATIASHWRAERSDLILLPVCTEGTSVLGRLQEDEQAALLGMAMGTAASGRAALAYGANLAFTRQAFLAVGGYAGDRFASGDDLFLLQRMQRAGKRITSLCDARSLVIATAAPSFRAFVQQRLRWVGKMRGAGFAMAIVGLVALSFPWILLWHSLRSNFVGSIGDHALFAQGLLAGAWASWLFPVIALVRDVRTVLGRKAKMLPTLFSLIAFSCYAPLIAFASLIVRPHWKGRKL